MSISTTLETLLALTVAALDHCLDQARQFRPNLVMFDSFAPWGRLISQILELPAIASIPSILINADIDRLYRNAPENQDLQLTPEWYAGFERRSRQALRPYRLRDYPSPPQLLQGYADLNLVYTSRSFQPLAEAFDPAASGSLGRAWSSGRTPRISPSNVWMAARWSASLWARFPETAPRFWDG